MNDYVKRKDVYEMLANAQIITDGECCGYCCDDISVSSIPAADVVEAVRCENCKYLRDKMLLPIYKTEKNYVQGYEVEDVYVLCPICQHRFFSIINGEECAGRRTNFCSDCGQAIDWSEGGNGNTKR